MWQAMVCSRTTSLGCRDRDRGRRRARTSRSPAAKWRACLPSAFAAHISTARSLPAPPPACARLQPGLYAVRRCRTVSSFTRRTVSPRTGKTRRSLAAAASSNAPCFSAARSAPLRCSWHPARCSPPRQRYSLPSAYGRPVSSTSSISTVHYAVRGPPIARTHWPAAVIATRDDGTSNTSRLFASACCIALQVGTSIRSSTLSSNREPASLFGSRRQMRQPFSSSRATPPLRTPAPLSTTCRPRPRSSLSRRATCCLPPGWCGYCAIS